MRPDVGYRDLTHEYPRSEVPGWVERISTVVAEADPEAEDGQPHHSREVGHLPGAADGDGEEGRGEHLVTCSAHQGQVRRGEGGEDVGSVGYRPESKTRFIIKMYTKY